MTDEIPDSEIPRRIRIDKMTAEERRIFDIIGSVEDLGAHHFLTAAVIALQEAFDHLADWNDLQQAS